MAVAHRGLRHLRDERLRVPQKQKLHFAVAVKFPLELLSDQSVRVSAL